MVDAEVTKMEDALMKEFHELLKSDLFFQKTDLPHRPDYGKTGVPVILRANHFDVHLDETRQLFLYNADVDQHLRDSKLKLRCFLQTILQRLPELQPKNTGPGVGVASDYISLVVTSKKIELGPTDEKTYSIPYYDREGSPVKAVGQGFTFTLSFLQPISFTDLLRHVKSSPAVSSQNESADGTMKRALNAIITDHPSRSQGVYLGAPNTFFQYSNENFSDFDLLGGLVAVRGYCYSTQFGTGRIRLNIHG